MQVGQPTVDGKFRGCTLLPGEEMKLTITKLDVDGPLSSLADLLGKIFLTPEAYLNSYGIAQSLDSLPDDAPAVESNTPGVSPPVPILSVNPIYTQAARDARVNGRVLVLCVVGTDGRIHQPRIVRGLEKGLDERTLLNLTLWRLKPAQRNGHDIAVKTPIEISFWLL